MSGTDSDQRRRSEGVPGPEGARARARRARPARRSRRAAGRRPARPGRAAPASTRPSAATGHHQLADLRPRRAAPARRRSDTARRHQHAVRRARALRPGRSSRRGRRRRPPRRSRSRAWIASVARMSSPRVGILRHDHARRPGQLAGDDHLLLIAAAQRGGRRVRPRRPRRRTPGAAPPCGPARPSSRAGPAEARDRPRREPSTTFSVSVSSGIRPSVVRSSGMKPTGPATSPPAAQRLQAPRDRAQQLALPVPLHRGDADDLARPDAQSSRRGQRCRTRSRAGPRGPRAATSDRRARPDRRGRRGSSLDSSAVAFADHRRGKRRRRLAGDGAVEKTTDALPQHGDPVGRRERLVQLVGDQHRRAAARREVARSRAAARPPRAAPAPRWARRAAGCGRPRPAPSRSPAAA